MKKLIIFLGIVFLFAQDDKYLMYVNKLVNYHFDLKNITDKEAPFEIKIKKTSSSNVTIEKVLVKRIKIDLLSIFNNSAHIKIEEYLGDQLIKSETKWVKEGDKIYECRVAKITLTKVVLKCKNKVLVKTLNKKIPGFKEIK
jgi:hypothetical protein